MHQEKIDQYVKTQLKPYEDSAVFTTWLKDSISILNSWGIKWPDDSDFSRLRAELSTTLTGRTKGKLVSKKTVATRIRATKKFYEWLKLQEENTQQIRLFETTEAGAIEPLSSVSVVVQEPDSTDQQEVTTGEETADKPKRGRKPKAENTDRVQVSVYLSRNVYEGLKALAQAKSLNLSDMVARTANSFFERNTQSIVTAQQALRNLETLNVEY